MNSNRQSVERSTFLDIKQEKRLRKASLSSMGSVNTQSSIAKEDMEKFMNKALEKQSKKNGFCGAPLARKNKFAMPSLSGKFNPLTCENFKLGGQRETLDDVNLFYSSRTTVKKVPDDQFAPKLNAMMKNFVHPRDELLDKIRCSSATERRHKAPKNFMVEPPKVKVHKVLEYKFDWDAVDKMEAEKAKLAAEAAETKEIQIEETE